MIRSYDKSHDYKITNNNIINYFFKYQLTKLSFIIKLKPNINL